MRDQNWFRGLRLAALGVGAVVVIASGCGNDTDGFTPEEWKRVKLIEPLAVAMPRNPANDRDQDDAIASLGQKLFYEKELAEAITVAGPSGNIGDVGKVGCVTCHDNKYFTDSRPYPLSHGRNWLSHNSPTMVNVGWYEWTFWAGTFDQLSSHGAGVWGTSATPLAQAHFLYRKYRDEYNMVFPDSPLDPALDPMAPDAARFPLTGGAKANATVADGPFEKMTKADQWQISQMRANLGKVWDTYPRKLVTRNSKFERYIKGVDRSEASFSPRAKNGLKLFIGKASCIDCHNGPLLSDNQFHNVGVPTAAASFPGSTVAATPDRGRAGALPGLLNTGLAVLRTNKNLIRMDPVMDQIPVFTAAGQFSADPDGGMQRLVDLDKTSCLPGRRTAEAVPAICATQFKAPRDPNPDKTPPDLGDPGDPRYQVCVDANTEIGLCASLDPTTGAVVGNFDPSLEGAFRTPQLINVAETGPYFHNGEFKTLRDVVWHYNNGGGPAGTFVGTKSPRIRPLLLSESEMDDLVEFLKTLTGDPPDSDWTCNKLLGPPAGCGPPGAGATGGASGGGGRGGAGGAGGGASGAAGGSAGKGGSAGSVGGGNVGGGTTSSGGAVATGGAVSTGGSVASSGGAAGGTGAGGAGGMSGGGGAS